MDQKKSLSLSPFCIMQSIEALQEALAPLAEGVYRVCINYKKQGVVELRRTATATDTLHMAGMVVCHGKSTKAALHRLAVMLRATYEDAIEVVGRTRAIKEFGVTVVDSVPHIQERRNPHYATASPRRLYDRAALLYAKEAIGNGKKKQMKTSSVPEEEQQ